MATSGCLFLVHQQGVLLWAGFVDLKFKTTYNFFEHEQSVCKSVMDDSDETRVSLQIDSIMDEDDQRFSTFDNENDEKTIQIGMNFPSLEELYQAYNKYAVLKGFGVRKGKINHYKLRVTSGEILCSCEGISEASISYEERQRERLEYRCYCKARVNYKVVNGLYQVVQFNDTHTHPMVDADKRQYLQSHRKLTPATKRIIESLVDSGVGPSKAFRYLANQAGGIKNVGCIEQDVHNYQQARRRKLINGCDAQSLIDYLGRKKMEDSNFYFNFKVDGEGRLCNVFWRDSLSKAHYQAFGDVMTFDTTYRTNKWNMVFAPFVGVNNHWQNIYFGCAFLASETTASFEWLFNCFLQSMERKAPKKIFTDQDHTMVGAIRKIMPTARHRLCGWHIEKNAVQNIPQLMRKVGFRDKFNTLLWSCKSEADFEMIWKSMITEWEAADNSWLERLYNLRTKWCPGFSKETFCCNIKSTQRGESANRVFSDKTCQATTLVEFIQLYEQKVLKVRDNESLFDTRTRGMPRVNVRDCGILAHAATSYTRTIFAKFQDEFMQCLSDWVVEKGSDDGFDLYTIYKEESNDTFTVKCRPKDCLFECTCHLFDTMGFLCCHALRVMHSILGLKTLPEQYIMRRWTKKAKQGTIFEDMCVEKNPVQATATTRLNTLLKESFSVMSMAADNDLTVKIAMKHLNAARLEIVECQNRMFDNADDGTADHVRHENNASVVIVHNPENKRKKGQKNVRMKSFMEEKKPRQGAKDKGVMESNTLETRDNNQSIYSMHCTNTANEEIDVYDDPSLSFTQLIGQVSAGLISGSSKHRSQSDNEEACFD